MLWHSPLLCPFTLGYGAEARSGGRRSFLPPGELNAGSRTLPPMAGCLPVLLLQEQPTHLWACWAAGIREAGVPGVGCPQGWAGSCFFCRVAGKWPPLRTGCQCELGLGSSEPACRWWGKTWSSLRISGLLLGPLLDGAGWSLGPPRLCAGYVQVPLISQDLWMYLQSDGSAKGMELKLAQGCLLCPP